MLTVQSGKRFFFRFHPFDQAGATRIRLLESAPFGTKPLEEFMIAAGWQPKDFASAATRVEFENTNFLGIWAGMVIYLRRHGAGASEQQSLRI